MSPTMSTAGMMQFLSPQLLDEKLKTEKTYWLERLSGRRASLGLPLDRPRPATYAPQREHVRVPLDAELRARLLQVSGQSDLLAFAILTAGVAICVHKYSGEEDITIGTPVHNRHREMASLNRVLMLRNQVADGMLVKQLFGAVKQSLADAYVHQKYPFSRLVDLLNLDQGPERQAGFQVAVGLEGINDPAHLEELRTDVTVVFSVAPDAVEADIQYDPRLFVRASIEQFGAHLRQALRASLGAPNTTIGDIDLLAPERRRRLVDEINRTAHEYPRAATLHRLFERRAALSPDAVAIECGAERVTFADLQARSTRLARWLRGQGVGRGQLVGLCVEHSVAMIEGLLGVLKAGAAYVPLDPSHPDARLGSILEDAGISMVLTSPRFGPRVAALGVRAFSLDHDAEWRQSGQAPGEINENEESLGWDADPRDLAYVIYTSGSTGRPKGVAIEHRSVVNYITWAIESYGLDQPLDVALYSSFAFDLTVTSIFGPLLSGNRMIVYPDRGVDHPLFDALRENRCGFLKMTPSHLSMVVDRGVRADAVRRVVLGGEALPSALAARGVACFARDVAIYNEYGPTEATVGCMIHRFDHARDLRAQVPIGRPAANTRLYILDAHDRPVAENMVGELAIAGDGLAREYLHQAELTAARFVTTAAVPGERVYRSGDLARWLPDGTMEYVGRKDEQAKIHGYRVELNELRLALNGHPRVADCVVLVRTDSAGRDVLAAYYAGDEPIDRAELHAHLKARVIEETIPNYFVHLAALPLTPNGKVDVQALPAIEETRAAASRAAIAPRTQTEELLAGVWALVLGLPSVGVTDDFFALGGHSLLAHQIISRARAIFHVEVPLRSLFESPTVEQLAAAIDRLVRARAGAFVDAIPAAPRDGDLPASSGQQRLWVMDRLRSGGASYNIYPSFELTGALNVAALEQSLNEIVRRHESLRTTFHMLDGRLVQRIATALTIDVPVTDLSGSTGADRDAQLEALVDCQVRLPFDLGNGPLVRAHLARLEPERHLLFIAMHHIVSDAASMGIFYREMAACYQAFCRRAAPELPPLAIQYADYAVWERGWLQGETLERQIAYWREQLQGAPAALDLYPGRVRPSVLGHEGTYTGLMLSPELSRAIREMARRERCTAFIVLLAAFTIALHHHARLDDIVVGADVANRHRPELEGVIGFLVNTLVLRTRFTGDPTFHELLQQVRETALDAFAHSDVPFDRLVEALNPERAAGQNPLFQVMFGFVPNNATMALDLPGVGLRPYPLDNKTSLFDFSLYMAETPEGFGGTAQYNTSLYDGAAIASILRSFELVLSRAAETSEERLSSIDAALAELRKQEQARQAQELKARRRDALRARQVPPRPTGEPVSVVQGVTR